MSVVGTEHLAAVQAEVNARRYGVDALTSEVAYDVPRELIVHSEQHDDLGKRFFPYRVKWRIGEDWYVTYIKAVLVPYRFGAWPFYGWASRENRAAMERALGLAIEQCKADRAAGTDKEHQIPWKASP